MKHNYYPKKVNRNSSELRLISKTKQTVTIKEYLGLFTCGLLFALSANAQTNPGLELMNERSMYSKVFLKENGDNEAVISSSPVHYQKNGVWEDINTTIIPNSGGYQNETNSIQSYFPNTTDNSNKIKLTINQGDEIWIHAVKKLVLSDNQNNLQIIPNNSANSIAEVNGNTINYPNIYTGISDVFTILHGEIKNNVILNAVPAFLNNVSSGYFGFQEILELPQGWKIIPLNASDQTFTSSSLLVIDAEGNQVLSIPAPIIFDQYGLESDGANLMEGNYLISQENGYWTITTLVPVAWLKDVNTAYPVSIDPTVVFAGTTGGWQSPNNFVDNPSFVFIGVCCANLTHRAWIKFNTTTIPDTSCITNVELQVNVTSVAATSAELVLINDVTGAFGPYGAINPAAYADLGNGFYNSFTITTTGIYGYYGLGATANTVLQSQLPVNWFQVGLIFNNEPSTIYKIISGTTSNLRVTYSGCSPLPIELISFDAKCNSGQIDLTWETASEVNNDYFTVQRTSNGIDFETIGTVAGAGNSGQMLAYSFVDTDPVEGIAYYSLKQTDFNGHIEHLSLAAVSCNDAAEFTISPNPSTGIFIIDGAEQNSEIRITDALGQIVFQTKVMGEKTEIDLSKYLDGIYFVQVVSQNGLASKKISVNKQ
jgi:Secretion system C-terminal sorting domain